MFDKIMQVSSISVSLSVLENLNSVNCFVMKDLETTQKLELVISQNVGHHSTSNTLFGVLNNCSTLGGQRRLRALILQPSTDEAEINARLDCVQELIENSEVFFSLKVSFVNYTMTFNFETLIS